MRPFLHCIFAGCFFLSLISCNKQNIELPPPPDPILTGQWIFMSNTVHSETITTYTVDGINYKASITADYNTYNNNGTVEISDSTIAGTNIRYDISGNSYFKLFIGSDTQEDSTAFPFSQHIDTSYNITKQYKKINADSAYFPEGIIMQLPDIGDSNGGEVSSMSLPQGGIIRFPDNNSLLLTTTSEYSSSYTEDGVTYYVTKKETVGMILGK